MNSESNRIANHRAAIRWGGFVVALLTAQVAVGVVAVVLATNDPSAAVLPDYYEKALHWDDQVQAEAASRELGWKLTLLPMKEGSKVGLQGQLLDVDGAPISIASGTLELYHHSHASEIDRIQLPVSSEGTFGITGCVPIDGLWQANIDLVDSDGNRFVQSQVVMVHNPKHSNSEGS
ncbi:FixH family protein [Novipirellula artificiosorum]|uniref:FixH n=1 Tax=Novipirellula artificiosorum TaxID=2528016 RepID=A0A5C6DNM0_9BACT|nr:FixH family protein [Novipirellula artificiosorum]TWU38440.1 FixH [Novipirellula artificiosorum]